MKTSNRQLVRLPKIYSRLEENTAFLEPPDWFRDLIFSQNQPSMGRGRRSQVIPLRNIFFLVPLIVSFDFRNFTWAISTFGIYVINYLWKRKNLWPPRFYRSLTSSISIYYRSNVKLHAGWSIFLCHLSENKCSK